MFVQDGFFIFDSDQAQINSVEAELLERGRDRKWEKENSEGVI
jgi:hypothetical protein